MLAEAMAPHAKGNDVVIGRRRDQCAAHHAKLEESWAAKLKDAKDGSPVHPAWISHCINEIRPKDSIIVKESPLQTQYIDITEPGTVLNAGAASGLGHGMGVAIGAKLAAPDRVVIGTEGDGAYMFNVPVSAHYVSAEQEAPVLWVVFNNQRWQAVRGATLGLNPDGYAAKANRAPLTYFSRSAVREAGRGFGRLWRAGHRPGPDDAGAGARDEGGDRREAPGAAECGVPGRCRRRWWLRLRLRLARVQASGAGVAMQAQVG